MKDKFFELYHTLTQTSVWEKMYNTSENSPYHRESSVGIHTDMVLDSYITLVGDTEWTKEDVIGAFVCAFHDVGKPDAKKEKFKPERGNYFSFNGHEIISARLFEDYAVGNVELFKEFNFNIEDIFYICWMIEHHRPYDYKKGPILQMLKHTLGQNCQYTRVFFNILRADVSGRIMDDHDKGKQKVESWIEMFEQVSKENVEYDPNRPSCFILIGCSGAGKSTYSLSKNNSKYYSWDQIRLDLYGDNTKSIKESYRLAFERSCEDKDFSKKTQQQFIELIKSKNNVIVDNTNRSRKSRRFFITEAKRHGYNVVGVLFPISLHTLKQRWETRRDKYVPWNTVEQQYMSLSLPSYYECDTIEIVTTQ